MPFVQIKDKFINTDWIKGVWYELNKENEHRIYFNAGDENLFYEFETKEQAIECIKKLTCKVALILPTEEYLSFLNYVKHGDKQ